MSIDVNISMVTHNRINLTKKCVQSLLNHSGDFNVHINIIDNGSTDGTREFLDRISAKNKEVSTYFFKRNMGVSVAANFGWAATDSTYYLKLDNDMEILKKDWLRQLVELAENNPELGMIGYKFCPWHTVHRKRLPSGDTFLSYSGCGGGCVLISENVHRKLGFWNEDYGRYGFEDLDYGNRVLQSDYLTGYADDDNAVMHWGYLKEVNDERENNKKRNISFRSSGEALYLLNMFLFQNGIRKLYVERKYIPVVHDYEVTFKMNPRYQSIQRIHHDFLKKFTYTIDGDRVEIDTSQLGS